MSHVSRNIDLSVKDEVTVLKLELSYGRNVLCVILVGCRSNIMFLKPIRPYSVTRPYSEYFSGQAPYLARPYRVSSDSE